jgi:hypothetical protein
LLDALAAISKSLLEHRTDEAVKKQKEVEQLKKKREELGFFYCKFIFYFILFLIFTFFLFLLFFFLLFFFFTYF